MVHEPALLEDSALSPEAAAVLVENHRNFLAFLERRVESRAVAEEILQAAFVRSLEKGGGLRDDESAVAWFYRVLRNAVIDHYRRRDAEARALEKEGVAQLVREELRDDDVKGAICACVNELIPTLKREYGDILRAVDLEEKSVSDVARSLGITPNNASVRLFRARQALKRQLERTCRTCATHGCLDCSCSRTHSA